MFFVETLIFNTAKENFLDDVKIKLDLVANLEAEKINNSIHDFKADLQIIQNYYNIKFNIPFLTVSGNKSRSSKYNQAKKMLDDQLITWLTSKKGFKDLMLVSPGGKIVYSLNPDHDSKDLGKTLPDPENLAFEQGKKGIYLTDIFKNERENNTPAMLVSGPVNDLKGNFAGVIALELDMVFLYEQLAERTDLGSTGETYLINKDKFMISPSKFIDNAVLNIKVETENAEKCFQKTGGGEQINNVEKIEKEQSVWRFKDYRGIEVIGTHIYIPEH
ncbi:MAG: cache domain-containing protein, partial [Candidatus Neomarinimicrobiota bacterium]